METHSFLRQCAKNGDFSSLSISFFPKLPPANAYTIYLHREDIPMGCVSGYGATPAEAYMSAIDVMKKAGLKI